MPSIPAVSIIVVNYNGASHLSALLERLGRQTRGDFELIVVDNGSTDRSLDVLTESTSSFLFPLQVIRNNQNLGFGPATNQGVRRSVSPWIATLNNDTRPEPEWLERMLDATGNDPNVGMIGAKLLRAQNPLQIDSAGIALDWTGIAWDRRGGEQDDPDESVTENIFGPCAGAALYSRAMLDEIGMFDEDFFAYMEDVDLAWRARLAGWRARFQPQARALHAHSATLGDASPRKRFLLARNKIWLLVKNYPTSDLARNLPGILTYDALATLYGMGIRHDFASLQGRIAGARRLSHFLKKRNRIQTRWQDIENWRVAVSPIEMPWAVSKRYAHLQQSQVPSRYAKCGI
jgi:GT2 family glycosyltransferase